jgi:N6-adenosine-specific RNA methylase IME4
MLPDALEVMAAWGFAYRTNFVWAKDRVGTGYWNRNQHELLLVGVKGGVPAPAPGAQQPSLIAASVREHSRKPDEARLMIEAMFPTLPKIELFARGAARPGWRAWGKEAEKEISDDWTA